VDYTGDERTQRQRQSNNAFYKSTQSANTHTAYNKEPYPVAGREECGAPLINVREVEYIHIHSTYQINEGLEAARI